MARTYRLIQALLGHDRPETTARYTRVAIGMIAKVESPLAGLNAPRRRRDSAVVMARPALEVADILRDHGPAWREANRGHVSLDQLKVMRAIERCRTVALGGHVARCENAACGHTLISYNSCRKQALSEVRGGIWLMARPMCRA